MMLIPLKVALNKMKENKEIKFIGLFIAILIISYLDFMLTMETLERQLMVLIYAFIISILVGVLSYSKKNESLTS